MTNSIADSIESRDYDYLIIGSGFGGSVSALRLAEKGWRVAVLEQGRRIGPAEIRDAKKSPLRKFVWHPATGSRGYSAQDIFKHVGVLSGVGVGGGSLVWGAVMLPPKASYYLAEVWASLGIDMKTELAPHLETAKTMLGVTPNPETGKQDEYLRATARKMGVEASYGNVPQAIYFGEAGVVAADPFFAGKGPARQGCHFCGECLAGCEFGAKNSLDKNYLYLGEKLGVKIMPETTASRIEPLSDGGYTVTANTRGKPLKLTAHKVIVAAGVIGSLNFLLSNRDVYGTLPRLSQQCGKTVRTNSEALTAVISKDRDINLLGDGAAISSDFYADSHTHITQNRIAPALAGLLRFMFVPMSDGSKPVKRAVKTLAGIFTRPRHWLTGLFGRKWAQRITTLTVMQNDDSGVSLVLKRRWLMPWKKSLQSVAPPSTLRRAPSYLKLANDATRAYAEVSNGLPLSSSFEALGNKAMTAHILGGCDIGPVGSGVIDARHEVHGYRGLFVVDGSAIPANLGVNPSLTITAMAERFAMMQPAAK